MRTFANLSAILSYLIIAASCSQKSKTVADLVLTNGQIYTVNKAMPSAEAVAIKDGKILFVGTDADVQEYIGDKTEKIDCKGQFVMPGFIEGHGHIHGLGHSLMSLDLSDTKSWEEIVAKVAEAVKKAKPGDWIDGRGWHQEKWDHIPATNYIGYPYHEELDKVSPDNPVVLGHASGHSVYVNAKALEVAGIIGSTKNPEGGEIVKDKSGKIVGVLAETAQGIVWNAYSTWMDKRPREEQIATWVESIRLAEQECLRLGVTSFQDAGSSFEEVEGLQMLAKQQQLNLRHWVMIREGNAELRAHANLFPIADDPNGFLRVKAVKAALDGALGSYGAWLLEPYSDRAGWVGENTLSLDSLKAIAEFCWKNNLQLCVHAIGDKANRETVNIFSGQIQQDKTKDHRWRIEHAQHVNPAEIPRFKEWNIIASMQAVHCTSDAPFVEKRLGAERAATGAYMWKAFLDAGVVVTNGTDVPVEKVNPLASYYAAVTRKQKNGTAFYPGQKLTREEALYSYTMANAYAAFQEKEKGSIEVGKYADIILLDKNLVTCKEEEIQQTKVVMTLVGGKQKFHQ